MWTTERIKKKQFSSMKESPIKIAHKTPQKAVAAAVNMGVEVTVADIYISISHDMTKEEINSSTFFQKHQLA